MTLTLNPFELVSVETKVTGQTYTPALRSFTPFYTPSLTEDFIHSCSQDAEGLEKLSAHLGALSLSPIAPTNIFDIFSLTPKTLLKFLFKQTVNDILERYHVVIGYCKELEDIENPSMESVFIPTYSFTYFLNSEGVIVFSDQVDYIHNNQYNGQQFEFMPARPCDVMKDITLLTMMDESVFHSSQTRLMLRTDLVLSRRENINPATYLKQFFNIATSNISEFKNNPYTNFNGFSFNLYEQDLNTHELSLGRLSSPISEISYSKIEGFDGIPLTSIAQQYPNLFDVIEKVKPLEDFINNYTAMTKPFGTSSYEERISQQLVLNALAAISSAGLESLHIKGSNLNSPNEINYTFAVGMPASHCCNDLHGQIKKACDQLQRQIFTHLAGVTANEKVNIIFDLYVTTFGVSTIFVQFPTEVDIKGKMHVFAFPTYAPTSWSPVLTTVSDAGLLAQRVYEQICLLNG